MEITSFSFRFLDNLQQVGLVAQIEFPIRPTEVGALTVGVHKLGLLYVEVDGEAQLCGNRENDVFRQVEAFERLLGSCFRIIRSFRGSYGESKTQSATLSSIFLSGISLKLKIAKKKCLKKIRVPFSPPCGVR